MDAFSVVFAYPGGGGIVANMDLDEGTIRMVPFEESVTSTPAPPADPGLSDVVVINSKSVHLIESFFNRLELYRRGGLTVSGAESTSDRPTRSV